MTAFLPLNKWYFKLNIRKLILKITDEKLGTEIIHSNFIKTSLQKKRNHTNAVALIFLVFLNLFIYTLMIKC